ncbi:MAG: hypothetical protein IJR46_06440 [Neisseriaceae bacterium]|nr:hypothetical protein [Neisseriaceae bacterium]
MVYRDDKRFLFRLPETILHRIVVLRSQEIATHSLTASLAMTVSPTRTVRYMRNGSGSLKGLFQLRLTACRTKKV